VLPDEGQPDLPSGGHAELGQCAYIDAAHRVHARVEDVIRTEGDQYQVGTACNRFAPFAAVRLPRGSPRVTV
jgi:hypothetical protein